MGMGSAIKAGAAYVELYLHDNKFAQGLDKVAGKTKALGTHLTAIGAQFTAAAGLFAVPFVAGVKAASSLEETMNKFNVVFGANSANMKAWGDDFAGQVGRSKRQIAEFLAGSQDLFVPLGFETGAAEDMSKQLTGLAVDLASFNNKADADVLRDLQSALTGSSEVMKKYGVIVNQTAVNQELLQQGIDPKTASEQEKVYARLAIIMKGTTAAQGDAIRSAGSWANVKKRLYGVLEDVAASLGKSVLPMVTEYGKKAVEIAQNVGQWIEEHQELIAGAAKVAAVVGTAGAAIMAIGATLTATAGVVSTVSAAVTGLSGAFAFLAANPVVLALAGVAAAAALVGKALDDAAAPTIKLADAQERLVAKKDAARKADLDALDRLQQLANQQSRTSDEMNEAESIIARLESRYGDLGLSIDAATGSILGAADAHSALVDSMSREAEADIQGQMIEASSNVIALGEEIQKTRDAWMTPWGKASQLSDLARQMEEEEAKLAGLTARYKALHAGDARALTGEPMPDAGAAAAAGTAPGVASPAALAALTAIEERNAQRLHDQKIAQIDDEQERELARIRAKYDAEREEARKLADDLAAAGNEPEAARALAAVAEIDEAEAAEVRGVENRELDDQLAAKVADLKERAAAQATVKDDVARLEIQANKEGLDEQLALLELDRKKALEEGVAAGVDPAEINKKFDLLGQIATQQAQIPAAAAAIGPRGTFSAEAAERFGAASDPIDRIAKATEESAAANKRSAKANSETAKNTRFTFAWGG